MLTKSYSNYQIRELVPEALVTLNAQDCFIYVNQIAGDTLNRKPDELIGKHIWTEFPEAVTQPVYKAYKKATESKQHVYLEEFDEAHDRWFENHIYQSPGGVSICFSDITERKKSESIFQSNELKYKAFFENSMDGVILGYPDGTVYAANAAACRIFERKEEEICSLGRTGLLDTSDPRLKKLVDERKEKGEAEGESAGLKRDGSKFPVGFRTKLFTDAKGREHTIIIIRDNSELNTAKDKIKEQELTLNSLINSFSNAVFSLDTKYCYTSFNRAYSNAMKILYGKEIVLGGCLLDDQTREDVMVSKPHLDRALAGESFSAEGYVGVAGLAQLYIEIFHNPVLNNEGEVIGLSIEAKDITARKKAEETRNESEALYRSILNASPDDITITDLEGRILMISPSALPIWGYQNEEEILGRSLFEFVAPEDIGRINENISLFYTGVNVNPGLYTGLRKDKSAFPIEVNAEFIRNSDGEPVKLVLSIRDITERKRAEQALIDSENKYRELVENSPDAIVIYQGAKVVFVNNESVRLMAAESKAQLIGKFVLDFVHPDYRTFVTERMKKAAVEGIILPMAEEKFVSLDGNEIDVEVKALPIMHENKPAVQLIVRDITESKKAELLKQEAVDRLLKISSRIPGVIYQYRLRPDGTSCFPYASENIRDIYHVSPEDVKEDASKVLAIIHPDDLDGVMDSIIQSAKNLTQWKYEYRVKFPDKTIHTLYGNAIPQIEAGGSVLWHGYISDITERKEAEKELANEQYLMNELMNHIPDDIYFKDMESRFIRINKAHANYFELTDPAQVLGKTDFHFFNDEHAGKAFDAEQEIIRTGQPLSIEEKAVRKDGSVKWTLTNKMPLRNREGAIIGTFGISKNITERKMQEEAIRESEEKWRKLVTSLPDFVALHDLDAKYTFLNHYAEGFSEKEVLGKSLYDFISQESREEFSQYFEACIKTNETKQFNHKAYGDNGVIKTYENVLVPIVNKNGEVVNVMSIAKDVTDRLLTEEAITTKAEQLERTGEIAKVGGWEFDLRIKKRFWSKETCRILEIDPPVTPEFESSLNYSYYTPESFKIIQAAVDEGIVSGKPYDLELQMKTAKGRFIWVREQGDFLMEEGKAIKLYGVIQDITEHKQSELALKMAHQSYFDIFNSVSEAIYIIDEKGIFIDVNKGAEEMYLFTREELIGQTPATVAAPGRNDLDYIQRIMKTAAEKDISVHFDFWAVRKNGEVFPKEVFVNKGKYFGRDVLIATARDMTESKNAEQALRESEQFLNETQRVSRIGSYKLDIISGMWECSKELDHLFGSPSNKKKTIDQWVSFVHPDHRQIMKNYFEQEVIGKKRRFDKEYKVVNQLSGKEYWVHGIGDLEFDANGNPVEMIGTIQDITEKKEAEEILHAKEKLFRALIENSNDGVVILDGWGNFRYIAPSIKAVLGYNEEELLNTGLLDITHPDDYEKSVEIYKEVLANPGLYNPSFIPRMKHKNGEWRCIAGAMNNLMKDPLVRGIIANFRDVTQQVLAEQAIRESEIKYRSLIDQAGDAIAIYEPSGKIIDVNKTGLQMLGYTKQEALAMKVTDFFLMEEMEATPMTYNKLQQGESSLKQRHFISKDGSLVFTEVRSQVLPDGRLLSIIRDLTERTEAQEKIKREKELSDSIISRLPGIFYLYDEAGHFIRWNKNFEKLSGYSSKEISRMLPVDFYEKDDQEFIGNRIKAVFNRESPGIEVELLTKDKRKVPLYINSFTIDYEGKRCLTGIGIDLTAKRKAEQEIADKTAQMENLSDNLPDTMMYQAALEHDGLLHFTYLSKAVEKLIGRSAEEVIDNSILLYEVIHEEDRQKLAEAEQVSYLTMSAMNIDVRMRHKSGEIRWMNLRSVPRRMNDGRVVWDGVNSDITERKHSEEQLRISSENYLSLVNTIDGIVWEVDIKTNQFIFVSQQAEQLLGYPADQWINEHDFWPNHIHEEDREWVTETCFKKNLEKKAYEFQYRMLAADGRIVWLHKSVTVVQENNEPVKLRGIMVDISSQKKVEEELRQSLEDLEVIYQLSSSLSRAASVKEIFSEGIEAIKKTIHPDRVSILLFDADNVMRFKAWQDLSEAYRKKTEGHSPWSSETKNPQPVLVPDIEKASYLKPFHAVTRKEGIKAMAFIPITQNGVLLGKFMLYSNSIRQFTQKESQLAQTISSHLANAIERKNVEKKISDYRFALDQSSIVDVSDSTGAIQYANENFCRISGYSMTELKGKDHRILKSGYHSKEHYENLWETVTSGHVWRSEVKNKAKDGSFYWVDSTIVPFLDDKGKPFQFITIRSDITKRKEGESLILNTLERYDMLSKATSDTIWDWDMAHNNIIYNQGILKNFGYKVTKVEKVKEWWDLNIHPDDRKKVTVVFEKAFAKRKTVLQVEYRYRCADGSYKYILDRAFIIYDKNKKPERMIGSMQDITNEKEFAIRIEKEVIDAQEREWNQIGMELHDNVNQILAASMLLMGLGKEKMERGQNAASIIHESEKHVGEAITEIRRLSHQLAPVSVDNLSLEQVFESLIETVNVKKQFKVKLQMKVVRDLKIPHKLQINLYRILQAQLSNIVKYSKATGINIDFKKKEDLFIFRIADNGIGFNPESHTTGIGMENIRRRAKVFSGEFKLNTSPGNGCEVIVEIPLSKFS